MPSYIDFSTICAASRVVVPLRGHVLFHVKIDFIAMVVTGVVVGARVGDLDGDFDGFLGFKMIHVSSHNGQILKAHLVIYNSYLRRGV